MSNKKQEAAKDSKPFDGLLKALFSEQSEEIISCLLPDSHRPEGVSNDKLNVELNRNTLSIDIGRHIVYEGEDVTFNLEAQSGSDDDLLPRMHEYALNLYRTYHRPVISVALLLFEECTVPKVPFVMQCGGKERSIFYPIIICMWKKDAYEVVEGQQRCLYCLLPTMKNATVDLLAQAVREMKEYGDQPRFVRHLLWFHTMLGRTTTISQEDKQKIEEVLEMQYPGFALFREDPVIRGMILEGELKGELRGEIKGIQDSILDIVKGRFSSPVVAQVQQTIAPSHNIEKLRTFLRELVRLSDEQEVLALLTESFPLPGEVKAAQEMILGVVSARFSPGVAAQVQQAIASNQDTEQLRMFHRQLFRVSDEQEVLPLVVQCFPLSGEVKAVQKLILDIVSDHFSPQVVAQVQQAIAPSQDTGQLRLFLRQLFGLLDEQEVLALVSQCFPLPGEIEMTQELILDIISIRFSPQVVAQVQQAIAPSRDMQQLKMFNQQQLLLRDEREVLALLPQLFPNSQEAQ